MTNHESKNRRPTRRMLPLLALIFVAWACSKSITQDVGDAMIDAAIALHDAGATLVDAGSDAASAQTPTVIPVTCTQTAENVTMTTQVTSRLTVTYEWYPVADPHKVVIERCGWTESVSCPNGGTCSEAIPRPGCRLSLPSFQDGQVFVECSRNTVVTNSMGVQTAESVQISSVVRLLVSP